MTRVPRRYATVEGLGFYFTSDMETLSERMARAVVAYLYRFAFARATKVFFLNTDDLADLASRCIVPVGRGDVLGAIGVDLEEWPACGPHRDPLTFTMIARLLREKGVLEFAEAARQVRDRHKGIRFLLIGPLDTNPGAIRESQVRHWVSQGVLEWVPWTDDVKAYLRRTSVYVLPSYREGVPRSTQEAMAMGRPIITTDAPGCRGTVVDGVNGFLIRPRDVGGLVECMQRFISNPSLVESMGRESRRLAEERFDARKISARFVDEVLGEGA